MYATDSIALIYAPDDDDTEPKRLAMVFATVPDEHETNNVSPVSTKFQPDIQSLASSALLSNQSLVASPASISPRLLGQCLNSGVYSIAFYCDGANQL
jgi:hypothetical protein